MPPTDHPLLAAARKNLPMIQPATDAAKKVIAAVAA
jgi:hypothetical protein